MRTSPRGTLAVLALALLVGGAGCGAGNGVDTGGNSVVIVHLDIAAGLPDLYQIEVDAHLGSAGNNNTLYFPSMQPIQSGATLGLLIKPTIKDSLDLMLYGDDSGGRRAAVGMGQVNPIVVGGTANKTISLGACPASGC
ncbi:MAG TPA: hypothetical protein VKQ32_29465 [Polyangia bacterium]|nr:hypothetical protein [Polyangia bacterium]